MQWVIVAIAVGLHVASTVTDGQTAPETNFGLARYGSHYLFSIDKTNEAAARNVRCAPCANDGNDGKADLSNYVDSDYRGNGADNLGYDWSPQAWGGLAFPQKEKGQDKPNDGTWNRGRGGRQMPDWGREFRNDGVNCPRCGLEWDRPRRPLFDHANQSPANFNDRKYFGEETRVTSPQLGVVVRDDSRIAYVPSQNGEMLWDGVSGGGMRWDGFSNGVSWRQTKPWDREGWKDASKSNQNYVPSWQRPGGGDPYRNPGTFRPYDDTTKGSSGWDNTGKGYYFANGQPGGYDHRDSGYASNWQYSSGNQMGWDGKEMKWNYGSQRWEQGNRNDQRYNQPNFQEKSYGPGRPMFGSQYPSQPSGYPNERPTGYPNERPTGYPSDRPTGYPNERPTRYPPPTRPVYPTTPDKNYLPHDRDPPRYPSSGSYRPPENNRPWDYSPNDRYDNNPPGRYPQPRPTYPRPETSTKYPQPQPSPYPGYLPYDERPGYDRPNKPWDRPSTGYGSSRPDPGANLGNRYPNQPGSSLNRPPPKGYYTGFITEISPSELERYPSHGSGSGYPDNKYPPRDKNPNSPYDRPGSNNRYPTRYPDRNQDRYPDRNTNRYPVDSGYPDKDRYPNYDNDRDQYLDRYPNNNYRPETDRYPSSSNYRPDDNRYPSNPSNSDYDRGPNPGNDNNTWNYGQDEHKDGIYRRAGGSYPPYRGGQYYTSSYLASASTPAGASQSENKTPVTKPDEVTESTSGTDQ